MDGICGTASHLSYAQLEFNKNRKFIINNVPPVTYEEVKQFIGGYTVSNISISKKRRHAIVTLVHGEEAEEAVNRLSLQQLLGTDVQVSLCSNDNMLCVTHLPLILSEEDFRKEVEPYGPVEKCFLMRSSQTGFSKGYGFVEYAHNRTKTTAACETLNGHTIGSTRIQCSFLDSTVLRFEDLHSRSLLVEGLPLNYTNSQELKNICSVIIEPEAFQMEIAERFAVVQYKDVDDADSTQQEIDGHVIENSAIAVSFGRPGVTVEELSQEAINARHMDKESSKLPPPLMPPDGRVVHPSLDPKRLASPVVKRLLAQNPEALEKFIELLGILQSQILKEQDQLQPGIMGPVPGTTTGPLMNPNLQIALLSVMMAQQIQQCQPSFIQEPSTQDFILNSLQQRQPCSGGKQPSSLLGSPLVAQANSLLKNAMNNSDTQSLDSTNANLSQPHFALFPGPEEDKFNTSCLQDFSHLVSALTPKTAATGSRRVTCAKELPKEAESNVCTNNSQSALKNSSEEGLYMSQLRNCSSEKSLSGNTDSSTLMPNPFFNLPGVGYANPFLASFIEQQIKNQVRQFNQTAQKPVSLLDLPMMNRATNGFMNPPGNCGPSIPNISGHNVQGKPGILGPPPVMYPQSVLGPYPSTPTSWNKPSSLMGSYMAEKRTLSFDDNKIPMKRKQMSQPQSLLGEPPTTMARNYREQTCYSDRVQGNVDIVLGSDKVTSLMDMNLMSAPPQNTGPNGGVQWGIHCRNPHSTDRGDSRLDSTRQSNHNLSTEGLTYSEQYLSQAFQKNIPPEGSYSDMSMGMNSEQTADNSHTRSVQTKNQVGSNLQGLASDRKRSDCHQLNNMQQTDVQPLMAGSGRAGSDGIPSLISREKLAAIEKDIIQEVSGSGSNNVPSLLSANKPQVPSVLQVKAHLVPSPEASPDGVYIGQHSQGLGGHYADSYLHG